MNLKAFKPVFLVLVIAAVAFLLHYIVFYISGYIEGEKDWHNPLFEIYGFFTVCSVLIVSIFVLIHQRDINNAGNSFLLLTIIKIAVAYGYFYDLLTSESSDTKERINFFIVFAVFLTIETIISIRILNNKQ